MTNEELLTAKQALEFFNGKVSRATLYRMAKDKKIKTKKKNGKVFFIQTSLEEVVDEIDFSKQTNVSQVSHETENNISSNERIIAGIRHEAYESGKKEGRLLLMGEKEEVSQENSDLRRIEAILKLEKDHLAKALRSERVQKFIALGFLFVWFFGWGVFYFKNELSALFYG